MSSKNCPETPRQRMIGMMYLFLTAMLAINVSPEILKSFAMVDQSLRNSVVNFGEQNKLIYNSFAEQNELNKQKVDEWYQKALKIKSESQLMIKYIQGLKVSLAVRADGPTGHPDSLKKLDNMEIPSSFLLAPLENPTKGQKLKDSIGMFKELLINNIDDPSIKKVIESSLSTPDAKEEKDGHGKKLSAKKWEDNMFGEKPTIAAISMLTKIQNDIRNSESVAINYLFGQINAKDIKVNHIDAFINPRSTYIMKGGSFQANIGIAAIDTTKKPRIFIGGTEVKLKDGLYEVPANQTGEFKVSGDVRIFDADGIEQAYKFPEIKYEVVEPFATVSATKMNVLYAGVDNPISVSVPGVPSSKLEVKMDNTPLPKDPKGDGYLVKPKKLGVTTIRIFAEIEGNKMEIGKGSQFRVKQLPPPSAFVAYPSKTKDAQGNIILNRFTGGSIRKRDLLEAVEIGAELQDADFETNYKVLGFELRTYTSLGNAKIIQTTGNKFDNKQMADLRGLTPGKEFFLLNFKVLGDDGIERTLPPMQVTITQ